MARLPPIIDGSYSDPARDKCTQHVFQHGSLQHPYQSGYIHNYRVHCGDSIMLLNLRHLYLLCNIDGNSQKEFVMFLDVLHHFYM